MKKLIVLFSAGVYATVLLVLGSCGGDGGGGTTVSDDFVPNTLEGIVDQQNKQADQFVSDIIAHRTAVNEYVGVFESAFPNVDLAQASGEDLHSYLGAEQAESLLAELQTISDEKIVPAAAAAREASSDLMAIEQQIEQILVGSPDSYSNSHELLANRGLFTTSVCVATAGVFSTVAATYLSCYDNFQAAYERCLERNIGFQEGNPVSEQIVSLGCLPARLEGFEACAIDVAVSAGEIVASPITAGWSAVQISIDYASAAHGTRTVVNVIGRERSEKRSMSRDAIEIIEVVIVENTDPEPTVTSFIARSENGTVQMPEGMWDLTMFAEGYARQPIFDVEISRFSGDTGIQVAMTPSGDLQNASCAAQPVVTTIPTPTAPDWDNDCGYDNTTNTGGATAIWSLGDPVGYTGRGLVCSDRNDDLWMSHSGVSGGWLLVDDVGKGSTHPTRANCFSQPAIQLNAGALIGGDWICPL